MMKRRSYPIYGGDGLLARFYGENILTLYVKNSHQESRYAAMLLCENNVHFREADASALPLKMRDKAPVLETDYQWEGKMYWFWRGEREVNEIALFVENFKTRRDVKEARNRFVSTNVMKNLQRRSR